ncbi:MAG: DUF5808 domain-containing protein [Bdellovibrionota bacterium]
MTKAKKPSSDRQKSFLGMPMRWDSKNLFTNLWNPKDERILPPKYFGIGWDLNFHALFRRMRLVSAAKPAPSKKKK